MKKKPRRHMFISQFWSAKKNYFFFIWAVFFEIIRKWPKFQKKTKTNFSSDRPINWDFWAFFGSRDPKKPSEGPKTPKKPYLSDSGSFWKNRFFSIFGPSTTWENAIITVILAILAKFSILKIASTNSQRYIYTKNIIFD